MAISVQIDPNEIQELKKIFQELDRDGNGSISFEELSVGLGDRENGEELLRILQAADTDGNGNINYTGKYLITTEFQTRWGKPEDVAQVLIALFDARIHRSYYGSENIHERAVSEDSFQHV